MPTGGGLLTEGGAFLVSIRQTFVVPTDVEALTFDVVGLQADTAGDLLLDAFEASPVDAQGMSVVPVHRPGTTSFLNRQEDGAGGAAVGVTVSKGTRDRTRTPSPSRAPPPSSST